VITTPSLARAVQVACTELAIRQGLAALSMPTMSFQSATVTTLEHATRVVVATAAPTIRRVATIRATQSPRENAVVASGAHLPAGA